MVLHKTLQPDNADLVTMILKAFPQTATMVVPASVSLLTSHVVLFSHPLGMARARLQLISALSIATSSSLPSWASLPRMPCWLAARRTTTSG